MSVVRDDDGFAEAVINRPMPQPLGQGIDLCSEEVSADLMR